ncbi:hypothetical protein LguiA_029028 [Lonicera macranthoides]
MGRISKPHAVATRNFELIEISNMSNAEEELMDFTGQLTENSGTLPMPTAPQTVSTMDVIPDDSISVSDSLNVGADSLSNFKTKIEDIFNKGENAVENSLDTIKSSINSVVEGANEAVNSAISKVTTTIDQTGELASNKLSGFSINSKETSSKAGIIAVDLLRRTIVSIEDYLVKGGKFVVYGYGSLKEFLPPDIHNVLDSSEEKAIKILGPVGTTFQQVYIALEGLERNLGLDPNDPIVPFVVFLGTSATLWGSYWVLTYGGYAGDLSPKSTFTLLSGKENAQLIDDFRERDGIPDLRRAARFRYANVTLPEIDGSVRKLLKSGNELNDTLIADVIRNLKIVDDRSKVIVMDADGTRSKGIARSLRKLGVKASSNIIEKPYLVQGGFRSWVKEGLRIKELKPETTLTILNEEVEAILEEVKPTPLKVLGYGVGFIATAYALLEWEKTLQFIGIVGLVQTIYRRVASYKDSQDFKQDVSQLLLPVKLGGQAISWAAAKLETNRNGLPTSPPSSSDVQSRVLQAAAKHESQPSDSEEQLQDSPQSDSLTDNVDLSEA